MRLDQAFDQLSRETSTPYQTFGQTHYQCAVTVANIPLRSLHRVRIWGFTKRIPGINNAILRPAAKRTPAATRHIIKNRPVERRTVSASLST